MGQVPLFIINLEETTPLPGSTFLLDIQAQHLHLFSSIEIENKSYVIIGIADIDDPVELIENRDATLDSLFSVGLFCEILDKESTDAFSVFTLHAIERVLIRTLHRKVETLKDLYTIWVKKEPVTDEFLPDEEPIKEDIKDIIEIFARSEDLMAGASDKLKSTLGSNIHLLAQMDLMAEHILQDPDRLAYLQQLVNVDRWNLLLASVSKRLSKKTKPIPPPVSKKVKTPENLPVKKLSWREKVETSKMPSEVRTKVLSEVSKLENSPKNSTEYAQTADYLRWVLGVPWGKTSYVPTDLKKLHSCLNETHYGLDEVKEHLLEIMCIQELQGGSSGAVLCFVGPAV